MTIKEWDIQIALGSLPITLTNRSSGHYYSSTNQYNINFITLKIGDREYSSRDYPWIVNLEKNHNSINIDRIRSAFIKEGILI